MHIRRFAAAAIAVLALAAPARAQDVPAQDAPADSAPPLPNGLRKGAWSLSFVAPGYSGLGGETAEFGVWEMVGPRTNVGVTLDLSVAGQSRETSGANDQTTAYTRLGLGLNARRYLATSRSVVPYVHGRVFGRVGFDRRDDVGSGFEENVRSLGAGADAGVGVEWFPVRQVSLSGHTGVRFSSFNYTSEVTTPEQEERESTSREGIFQTFTSALSLRIYF
ncbi:MAG TPA: hypothetical protein VLK84_10925 [Longimicrobium sp.]|nr:hypothetical protein [Longimicrobium sp.]